MGSFVSLAPYIRALDVLFSPQFSFSRMRRSCSLPNTPLFISQPVLVSARNDLFFFQDPREGFLVFSSLSLFRCSVIFFRGVSSTSFFSLIETLFSYSVSFSIFLSITFN